VEILQKSRLEKEGLKHDLIHEQVTHEALKAQARTFEEQINTISEYWEKEYIKVSDELFDLKNAKKDE
jgi:predicted  nucleic acid-binding Zn-ribbon protein